MLVLLLLRFALAPLLILAASAAQRRFGAEAGGRLLGLPLLSVPVVLTIDLQHGPGFAETAARGTLAGTVSAAAFAAAYAHTSRRHPSAALLAGCAGFAAVTVALSLVSLRLAPLAVLVSVSVLAALRSWPRTLPSALASPPRPQSSPPPTSDGPRLPGWELALRMLAAAAASYGLTEAAAVFGPHVAGLLSPFPVLTTILALFARHRGGAATSLAVVRGMLTGLVGFTACFALICAALPRVGLVATFAAGLALAALAQSRPVRRLATGALSS